MEITAQGRQYLMLTDWCTKQTHVILANPYWTPALCPSSTDICCAHLKSSQQGSVMLKISITSFTQDMPH